MEMSGNGAVQCRQCTYTFSLNAMLRIADGTGGRMVPIRDFYLGPGKVDLHQGDVLTHIVIPGSDYRDIMDFILAYSMRNAMDIATLSIVCSQQNQSTLKKVHGGWAITTFWCSCTMPYRCAKTEEALRGMEMAKLLYQKVEELVRGRNQSQRFLAKASKAFRLQIGGEIAKRAEGECSQGNGDGSCSAGCPDNFKENMSSNGKIYPSSDVRM